MGVQIQGMASRFRGFLGGMLVAAVAGAAPARWQHGASPYRAEFRIVSRPNLPAAGVFVQVPVCGLAEMTGNDLVVYDEKDRPLPLLALGPGADNSVLAVVGALADSQEIAVYFGGRLPSAQNPQLRPGVVVDIHPWSGPAPAGWSEVEKALKGRRPLATVPVGTVELSYNPLDSRDAFVMDFRGWLLAEQSGPQTFMLVSDDAGYLFINGKLIVERNGAHSAWDARRGEARGTAPLVAGLNPFRCVVVDAGGDQMAVVARWLDPRKKATLRREDFAASGESELAGASSRQKDADFPAFTVERRSYMGWQETFYTEVELRALNGHTTEWAFGDGSRLVGGSVRRILVGTAGTAAEARQGRLVATGRIALPEQPPSFRHIGNFRQFKEYSAVIRQEGLARLDLGVLRAYRQFLAFQELNPDLVAVDEALLQRPGLPAAERLELLLEAARGAAAREPDKAAAWYDQLGRELRNPEQSVEVTREAAEFHLFRRGDEKRALALAERLAEIRHEAGPLEAATIRYLVAAGRGDPAAAGAEWAKLAQAGARWRDRLALPAVKRNELEPRVRDLLERGFCLDARRQLRQWERLAPEDWQSGRLPYARARLWRAWGWPFGALRELEAAKKLFPLLPNLPDVEYLQADILLEIGHQAEGRKLLERIVQDYPNHPVAAAARRRLGR